MKTKLIRIFIFALLFTFNLSLSSKVFAADLIIIPSKEIVGKSEQFYVDLMLDTKGESINAIKGSISFPSDKVTFLRAEEGKSIINLWVEKPKLNKNVVNFAGLISNGFEGTINPFNSGYKLPGLIIRLVFEANGEEGGVGFSTSVFSLNLNDGKGTEISISPVSKSVNIGDFTMRIKYENDKNGIPQLEAYVTQDINIYNNKYVLIFNATDTETGIKNVRIKEGRREWKEIESPYLLLDQSRHNDITVQATNFSGSGVAVNIEGVPYDWKSIITNSLIVIVAIILCYLIIKKIYVKKKK